MARRASRAALVALGLAVWGTGGCAGGGGSGRTADPLERAWVPPAATPVPKSEEKRTRPRPPRPDTGTRPDATPPARPPPTARPVDPGGAGAAAKPEGRPGAAAAPGATATRVRAYVERLKATPGEAEEAYRELWEVPRELVPALILEVENPEPSGVTELKVLVVDTERFLHFRKHDRGSEGERVVFVDEKGDTFVHDIPGLGRIRYDEIAMTRVKSGTAFKVVLRDNALVAGKRVAQAFPVGIVIRAALINRFQSSRAPVEDHRLDTLRWWQDFYESVKGEL